MTNERKAMEIADVCTGCADFGCCEHCSPTERYYAAMDMAEWKDDYYKKLLDLLVESGADVNIINNYIKNCIE